MGIPLWDGFFARIRADDRLHIAWCVTGVIGCLVAYGILQARRLGAALLQSDGGSERASWAAAPEHGAPTHPPAVARAAGHLLQERIMQEPFGGETFSYSLFLVLCNRIVTCIVALTMLLVRRGRCSCCRPRKAGAATPACVQELQRPQPRALPRSRATCCHCWAPAGLPAGPALAGSPCSAHRHPPDLRPPRHAPTSSPAPPAAAGPGPAAGGPLLQLRSSVCVQRGGHVLPVRGAQARLVPGADPGQVRQDDPGHDLGHRHHAQAIRCAPGTHPATPSSQGVGGAGGVGAHGGGWAPSSCRTEAGLGGRGTGQRWGGQQRWGGG